MKVLITSDWHLDASTAGRQRFDDVVAAIDATIDAAMREGVELYIFLGDLTDPDSVRSHRAAAFAVKVATSLWFRSGIASRWVVGNHDVIEDGSGDSTLAGVRELGAALPRPSSGVPGVRVFDRPFVEDFNGRVLLALPFTPRSHPYDPSAFVESLPDKRIDVVLGHLNIEGIEPGSESVDMPRGRDVFLPSSAIRSRWPNATIVNGHYHRRQTFDGVHVPGSLARLTFGEEQNSPGFIVAEV